MPIRLCLTAGCPNRATYRGRCADCARDRNRETRSRNAKVYNSKRWRLLRRAYLFDHSLCEQQGCGEIATDVHHKHAIGAGGPAYDRANLEALCHSHHSQLTRREQTGATT